MAATGSTARDAALPGGLLGLLLAALFLWPCLAGGSVPGRGDLVDFFWPLKGYTALRWAAGSVPLWNPLSGCGEPWLAQLQTGVFYPGDLPFHLPWPFGPLAGIALHLAVAGAGMAAWLHDLGTSRAAALAGAAVYAGAGAFTSLFPVYNNACTAAFLPWVFLGARRLVNGRTLAGFSAAMALAFLAGEPALAAFGGVAAAAVALWSRGEGEKGVAEGAVSCGRRLVLGGLLAVALAAVALLPFAELLKGTGRLAGATREEALARSVGAGDLADLLVPATNEATRGGLPHRGSYLATLALGPLPVLLIAGCGAGFPGRRRLLAGLAAVGGIGLLLALGAGGGLASILYAVGLFRGVRFPARWFVYTHLFLAFAAGAGLDGWLYGAFRPRPESTEEERPEEERRARAAKRAALAALVLAVALLPLLLVGGVLAQRDGLRAAACSGAALLAGLLVLAARRWGRLTAAAAAGCVALLVGTLVLAARDPFEAVPAAGLDSAPAIAADLPRGETSRTFAAAADAFLLVRWTMPEGRWTPESPRRAHAALAGYGNLAAGVPTVGSASPIANPLLTRLLGVALTGGPADLVFALTNVRHLVTPFPPRSLPEARLVRRAEGVSRLDLPSPAGRAFFADEVRVAADDEVFGELHRPGRGAEAVAFVAEPPGPLPAPFQKGFAVARIARDEAERMEIATNASAPRFLVVTRSYAPGWEAEVDGQPVRSVRTDLCFTGLLVPAGEHVVSLRYRPLSFRLGSWISAGALAVLLGVALAGRRPGGS